MTRTRLHAANLTGAHLAGVSSGGITGLPTALPSGWRIVGHYLVGPRADLADANLAELDLGSINLSGANLTGVSSGGIIGTPVLPAGWILVDGYLVGPQANLTDASLSNADLAGADLAGTELSGAALSGVSSGGITGTPSSLPTGWLLANGYLVGPQANLTNADLVDAVLTNSDLNGTNLTGADLSGVVSGGIPWGPAYLPPNWSFQAGYLLGPSANLTSADLSNVDLGPADLTGANLTDADLDNANLTAANLSGVIWSNTTCPDGTNSNNDADTCTNDLGYTNSDWTAQSNLEAALSSANSIYAMNHESFPSTASLVSSLATSDSSLTFTTVNSTNTNHISVFSSPDGNGIILAAYAPTTENCWYIYENQGQVLYSAPYSPNVTGQYGATLYVSFTTDIVVTATTGTYYAEVKGDNSAPDCDASQPVASEGSEYVFQGADFPDL